MELSNIKFKDRIYNNRNLIYLLILGVSLRLYAYFHTYLINRDGVYYIFQANALFNQMWDAATTCGYSFVSLYPVFIALFYKIFNDWTIAAKAVSLFFGTATIVPVYFLLRHFFSDRVSSLTTLLFVCNPFFVLASASSIKGPVFWFFSSLAILTFVKAVKSEKGRYFILSTLLLGLAFITRIEAMTYYVGSILYLIFRKGRTLKSIIYFGLPVILLIVVLSGSLVITTNDYSIWSHYIEPRIKIHSDFVANAFDNELADALKRLDSQDLKHFPPDFFGNLRDMLWFVYLGVVLNHTVRAFHVPYYIVFLIGFIYGLKIMRRERMVGYFIFLMMLAFMIVYLHFAITGFASKRFIAVVIFPSIFLMGLGVEKIIDLLEGKGIPEKTLIPLVAILIVVMALPSALESQGIEKRSIREIGEYIARDSGTENVNIATSESRILFYSDLFKKEIRCPKPAIPYKTLTGLKYPALIEALRDNNIQYFVWEERNWMGLPDDFLSDVRQTDMNKMHQWGSKGHRMVLYKVMGK